MSATTILRYLCGQREAIQQVAASRQAIWLGLLFVLTAGFAREYDGEDLVRSPWHLLLPLGASLVTATLLYALMWVAFWGWRTFPEGFAPYRRLLALYWMTAPLAWLYALPVERFLSPVDAVRANLVLLGLVSLWRVALMCRVIAVVFRAPPGQAFAVVMLFADTVALAALALSPWPVIDVMGGVRLSESENLILAVSMNVTVLGVLSWPVWALGVLAVFLGSRDREKLPSWISDSPPRVRRSAWALAATACLASALLALWAQPEQRLRSRVERDLRRGRIAAALETMSEHQAADFPPHWDPPPRPGYGESNPPLIDVLEGLSSSDSAPWVRQLFQEKLRRRVGGHAYFSFWTGLDTHEFDRWLSVLEQQWEELALSDDQRDDLSRQLEVDRRTAEQRARLQRLLDRGKNTDGAAQKVATGADAE